MPDGRPRSLLPLTTPYNMRAPSEVTLEDVPCPLGCEGKDALVLTGCDTLHQMPGEFAVVRCESCGLMRTNPRPAPESIGRYYPDDYGPYLGTRVTEASAKPKGWFVRTARSLARRLFPFKTDALPPLQPGRMLEIGCASGTFLHKMAQRGWQVQGIEFSDHAAQAAARLGHPVHVGPLETAPQPEGAFDLVVGWMVLEHLHDPVGSLRKLRQWSTPHAWLALSVPNAASLEFRLFKDQWFALQLPTHLHHFTPETIGKVLDAGGWELVKIHHQRTLANLLLSLGLWLRHKGHPGLARPFMDLPNRSAFWYGLYPVAWLAGLFGQTGRMTVWARPSRSTMLTAPRHQVRQAVGSGSNTSTTP